MDTLPIPEKQYTPEYTPEQKEKLKLLVGDLCDNIEVLHKYLCTLIKGDEGVDLVSTVMNSLLRNVHENVSMSQLTPNLRKRQFELVPNFVAMADLFQQRDQMTVHMLIQVGSWVRGHDVNKEPVNENTLLGSYFRMIEHMPKLMFELSREHVKK